MAQTYEIDINRFNGTDYDILLPTPATHAITHKADGTDPLVCQTGNYGDSTVTTAKIVNNAVTVNKIADNAVSTIYTGNLTVASWSGSAAPYSQAVTITGVLATDTPIVDLVPSTTYATAESQIDGWANIYRAVASANTITFYATDIPTVSLSFQARCIRK
nr:MAG TPA: hypothetical protein [Caudoviricetes sp.]